jgi:diguanylate cyclase (GGDEF)-like protein/PAS domain S-box-containing protein
VGWIRARLRARPTEIATLAVVVALLLAALAFPGDRVALLVTAGCLAGYLVLWFHVVPAEAFGRWHFLVGTLITQSAAVLLLAMTGGATSGYFTLYVLGLLATALRPQPLTSAAVGVVSVAAYAVISLAPALTQGIDPQLDRVASRGFALVVLATFVVLVARALEVGRTELAARTQMLDELIDAAPTAVVSMDESGRITRWNGAAERMFGRSEAGVLGRTVEEILVPPRLRAAHTEGLSTFLGLPEPTVAGQPREVEALRVDGSEVPVEVMLSAVRSRGHWSFTAFMTDISARRRHVRELERLAEEDALTGLANRRHFYARLRQVVELADRQGTALAVMLADLDGLKRVNDTHGHQTGDELLRRFSERLISQVRESDTVARLGGDEFACVLPGNDLETGQVVARKILRSCQAPFLIDGRDITIGLSIGVAAFPADGDAPEELLHSADLAMYSAKRDRLGVALAAPRPAPAGPAPAHSVS